jgi:HPt (histidine-containing phosphotransfer) domain-containing protein
MLEGKNNKVGHGAAIRGRKEGPRRHDLQYLRDLSGNDIEFIKEIVQMFIDDAPVLLKQAIVYHKNENVTLLKASVHRMKSSVKMMGDQPLAELIERIESHCIGITVESNMPSLMMQLNRDLTDLVNELKSEMQSL